MTDLEIILKTPFVIQRFSNVNNFIMTIVPDLEPYLKIERSQGFQKSDLDRIAYSKLQSNFKLFIARNYLNELEDYLDKKSKHINKESMKDMILSTISITLNVSDANGNKLNENDYLISLRNIIDKFEL
ncbi:MAG: hypothetical protein M3Y25_05795 [Thermoproteota archaeon]|nr:hypothetical protein [Thermoproteota archaeon]